MQLTQQPSIQAAQTAGRFSDLAPTNAQPSKLGQGLQPAVQEPVKIPQSQQATPQVLQIPAVMTAALPGSSSVSSSIGVNTGLAAALAGLSQSQLNSLAGLLGQGETMLKHAWGFTDKLIELHSLPSLVHFI